MLCSDGLAEGELIFEDSQRTTLHAGGKKGNYMPFPVWYPCRNQQAPRWRSSLPQGHLWSIRFRTVPCKDEIEQRIQQVLPALLRIARPDDQCALRVRSCCRKFVGAFVGPVQSVNKRGSHLGVELKIEITHSRFPLLRWARCMRPKTQHRC